MPEYSDAFSELNQLVLSDPRSARTRVIQILEDEANVAEAFLLALSRPDASRLRSLVANIAKASPYKERLAPVLRQWREIESDEFTRRAIEMALQASEYRPGRRTAQRGHALPSQTIELYRYVSDRLKHRLRNTVFGAEGHILQLSTILSSSDLIEARSIVGRLSDAMTRVHRALESVDAEPGHFAQRRILLVDWLEKMNARYASQYPAIRLSVDKPGGPSPAVFASDYLLEAIFWNLWVNAHQVIGRNCEITTVIRQTSHQIDIHVLDNGPGFPETAVELAFSQQYSSIKNSRQRGRGLLEVAEAVDRLGGTVSLFRHRHDDYRVKITFPVPTFPT
jgi:signal transduction histidine kinase